MYAASDAIATVLLQPGLGSPLVRLLIVILAIGVVILVGRLLLRVAWRLVTIAAVVVGLLLLLSFFGIGLF